MAYNKNDLIQFIEDSIKQNQGALSPTMVKDIEAVVKAQVEMGDASVSIQALNEDTEHIKRLLEEVLEGSATGEVNVNVTNVNNVDATSTEDKSEVKERRSFRDALKDSVKNKKDSMSFNFDGLKSAWGEATNAVGNQINRILGEEKENVIDPLVGIGTSIGRMFGGFITFDEQKIDLAEESNERLNDIYDINTEQLDFAKESADMLDETLTIQQDSLDLAKKEALRLQREEKDDKKNPLLEFIKKMLAVFAVGLVIGGILRSIVLPFQVLEKMIIGVGKWLGIFSKTVKEGEKSMGLVARFLKAFPKIAGLKNLLMSVESVKSFVALFKDFGAIFTKGAIVEFVQKMPDHFNAIKKALGFVGDAAEGAGDAADKLKKLGKFGDMLKGIGDFFSTTRKTIATWYAGTSTMAKMFQGFGGVFKRLLGVISFITKYTMMLPTFLSGIAKGFKWLGWPFAVLFGVIDFIKGFVGSSEKTFLGKLKDGLTQVIVGFFEMPLRLLGWIYDKAMNFIGIESSGSGQAMVDGLRNILGAIFDPIVATLNFIIKMVVTPLKFIIKNIVNQVKMVFSLVKAAVLFIWAPIKFVLQVVAEFVRGIVDMVKGALTVIFAPIAAVFAIVGKIFSGFMKLFTGDVEGALESFGGIKEILVKTMWKMWDGIVLFFQAPINFFKGVWKHFVGMLGNMVNALIDFIKAPFLYLARTVGLVFDLLKDLIGDTIFDPIVSLFEKIGKAITGVWDWVKGYLKKIPGFGDKFKDESEMEAEKLAEEQAKVIEIQKTRDTIAADTEDINRRKQAGEFKWYNQDRTETNNKRDLELAMEQAKLQESIRKRMGIVEKSKSTPVGTLGSAIEGTGGVLGDAVKQSKHMASAMKEVDRPVIKFEQGDPFAGDQEELIAAATSESEARFGGMFDKPMVMPKRPQGTEMIAETPAIPTIQQPTMPEVDTSGVDAALAKLTPHISTPMNQFPTFEGADPTPAAKVEAIKKQMKTAETTTAAINKMSKEQREKPERPIVVNTPEPEKKIIEPPEDIEAMSILFLNKSWGLG